MSDSRSCGRCIFLNSITNKCGEESKCMRDVDEAKYTSYLEGKKQGKKQGRADAIQDIRVEIANRVPSRPITKRGIEVWEDKYWLLINLDKKLEQMQKGAEQ